MNTFIQETSSEEINLGNSFRLVVNFDLEENLADSRIWVICVIIVGNKDQWCTVGLMQPAYVCPVTAVCILQMHSQSAIPGHLCVKDATCSLHL